MINKSKDWMIDLNGFQMVSLSQWPDGMWSASGWDKVWHLSDRQPTIEIALRRLLVERDNYLKNTASTDRQEAASAQEVSSD